MISIMSGWKRIFEGARSRKLAKGTAVFRRNDPVRRMYLVNFGVVTLERALADGGSLTLHRATSGMALAEASLFAGPYHCDAIVQSDAEIASVPREGFLKAVAEDPATALSLIENHAREVQAQRTRIEILRLRRVADRLDAWLAFHGATPKGSWSQVAEQIGVSPPALYRELARRRT